MDTRQLTKIALCVALCCVAAYISFPLPFTPGYVTALTLTLSLAAFVLPPKQTLIVVVTYILIGAVGIPVFAGQQGLAKLLGPTGGFYFAWMIAFPLLSAAKGAEPNFKRYAIADVLIAVPITYVGGIISMMVVSEVSLSQALMMAVLPFIPGDVMKACAAAWLGVKLNRALPT